ncbi:MAG: class I SAM-dependent methyltransferase [Lysobacter sp.]|nr:class I SAM-dependent methyltransferase [Lysobacter sp.]MDQ3269069.1 class I SAM-dependent methyltransferase [Pseudomonadota bacterium]
MAQYQSFPDAAGDSLTLDKLKALRLPDLAGRSFLDIGCNEGFFCGFASYQGASRSLGIDHSAPFIERARRRFPQCEFLHQGWDELPEGLFDAILLASALHYADDQPALLHRLMQKVAPDGLLILEIGIVSARRSEWVKVTRGIDERYFPTMSMLHEVLKDYAWKWMGPSVTQSGDPVSRHVIHISHRRPVCYLLLQPPAYGKTSIANSVFPAAKVTIVSGDEVVRRAVKGEVEVADELRESLASNYSPFALDLTMQRIFEEGLGEQLVALWVSQAGEGDIALDAYVPVAHHAAVRRMFTDAGYLPVLLLWERVGLEYLPTQVLAEQAESFYLSMAGAQGEADSTGGSGASGRRKHDPVGFIDELALAHGQLNLRGWAVDENGSLPPSLTVRLGDHVFPVAALQKQIRPDVQRHLQLSHGLVGFRVNIPTPGLRNLAELRGPVEIFAGDQAQGSGKPFQLSAEIVAQLRARTGSGR